MADDVADVTQMPHIAAFEAADHRIRLAARNRERRDHRIVGAHQRARRIRRDAAAAGDLDIGLHIGTVARIVLGIDEIEIATRLDRQAEALNPRLDHGWTADQDQFGQPLLQHLLGGAQHALVLTFGVDHPHRLAPRLGEQWPHDQAGAESEALQESRYIRRNS